MAWKFPSLSRRAFMKTAGAGGTGLDLLSPLGSMVGNASAEELTDSVDSVRSIFNFCSLLCNLCVKTETRQRSKRITKLSGNPNSTVSMQI